MKTLLIILVFFAVCGFSCSKAPQKYPVYCEDGAKIAELLSLSENEFSKVAYLYDYTGKLHKWESFITLERVAKYYDIEGYTLLLYDYDDSLTIKYGVCEDIHDNLSELIHPYQYRRLYINKNNDTIAKLVTGTDLVTKYKYTNIQRDSLNIIINYFGNPAKLYYIYDQNAINKIVNYKRARLQDSQGALERLKWKEWNERAPESLDRTLGNYFEYNRMNHCYAINNFNLDNQIYFVEDGTKGNLFYIDSIRVRNFTQTKHISLIVRDTAWDYEEYTTSYELNDDQIKSVIENADPGLKLITFVKVDSMGEYEYSYKTILCKRDSLGYSLQNVDYEKKKLIKEYGISKANYILNHKVDYGMTFEECREAWGRCRQSFFRDGIIIWEYPNNQYLEFKKDELVAFSGNGIYQKE